MTGFKTRYLIDLEGDRPTQMACPLLEWFKNLDNSWSLNVAVVSIMKMHAGDIFKE